MRKLISSYMDNKWAYCLYLNVIIFIFAIWIQNHSLICGDVSFLIHTSEKLLAGGSYGKDFFESNPPIILFLYFPVIFLTKFLGISLVAGLRLYVFLIAFVSLLLCYQLGKILFKEDENVLFLLLVLSSIAFVLLPSYEFGQREHLTIMIITPYLMACALSLNKQAIPYKYKITIGILAGLGFAIKPFFLIPLILIELLFIFYRKNIMGWVRAESIIILMIMFIYLFLIVYFTPEYIYIMAPLSWDLFYAFCKTPFFYLITDTTFLLSLIPVYIYFFTYKQANYYHFRAVLFMALVGFTLSYFLQHTTWLYHMLPLLVISLLLTGLLCAINFSSTLNLKSLKKKYIAAASILLALPTLFFFSSNKLYYYNQDNIWTSLMTALQRIPNEKTVCYLGNTPNAFSIIVDYANKTYSSRFGSTWWIRSLVTLAKTTHSKEKLNELLIEKNYLMNMFIEDLEIKHPDILITMSNKYNFKHHEINYLTFCSSDKHLHDLLNKYVFLFSTPDFNIYKRVT